MRAGLQQPANSAPVPPPPKPKSAHTDASKQENEDILNAILPPRYSTSHLQYIVQQVSTPLSFISTSNHCREWIEGNQLWVQQVSSAACTRTDVIHLEELLDTKLQQRQARETGICPIRRELHSQCFGKEVAGYRGHCGYDDKSTYRPTQKIHTDLQEIIASFAFATAGFTSLLGFLLVFLDYNKGTYSSTAT